MKPSSDKHADKDLLLESTWTDEAMKNLDRMKSDEAFRLDIAQKLS